MKKYILPVVLASFALVACDNDDYTDWAQPEQNTQVEAVKGEMTVAAASAQVIDLAKVEGETVKLINVTIPAYATVESYKVSLANADGATYDIYTDAEGNAKVEDLNNAVVYLFDHVATERELTATVSANATVKGQQGEAVVAYSAAPFVVKLQCIPVAYGEFFYAIGGDTGWSSTYTLYGPNFDGAYQGYGYLSQEFKFKPNADNWDDDLEFIEDGRVGDVGGANCPAPAAGFYQINLNVAQGTYSLYAINSIGLIGGFNDWSSDAFLTYNVAEGCWEGEVTFASDTEYKFRANSDWGINWGGSPDALWQDGSNLKAEAGTYSFKLYITYNGGSHVTITKK